MQTLTVTTILALGLMLAGCNRRVPVTATSNPANPVAHSEHSLQTSPKLLRITATIDGSDRFMFSTNDVEFEHKFWALPTNVTFDGQPWTELDMPPAGWKQLAKHLDLSKARIVKREGRDVIALEQTEKGFDLYFSDSPGGAGDYDVTIAIPRRE
jgi:hypothetical protein